VISWLGTGVARVLRMNASEPMVGWKGTHTIRYCELRLDIKHQPLDLIDGHKSLRSAKVNLADLLVHGPQSTHVIDIIGNGR
jgi:hypothetical protein